LPDGVLSLNLECVAPSLTQQLAHEIQGPLTSLAVRLRTAAEREPKSELVGSCLEEVTALQELVVGFLELEGARVDPEPAAVDVAAVLATIEARYRPIAESRSVRLSVEGSGERDILAAAQPSATERILSNLLDNAIKFSRQDGKVDVRLRRRSGEVRVEVQDDGIGIPADAREKIFEAFYRADRQRQGSGLGLAIARRLAEAQNARLLAESEPGRGATFTLTLKTR